MNIFCIHACIAIGNIMFIHKVVISALGMLALYMRFNGTGIWGGETKSQSYYVPATELINGIS